MAAAAADSSTRQQRLFRRSVLDGEDSQEQFLRNGSELVLGVPVAEREVRLRELVRESTRKHDLVMGGLVMDVLTSRAPLGDHVALVRDQETFKLMWSLSLDGLRFVSDQVLLLVSNPRKWDAATSRARAQTLWLLEQLIQDGTARMDRAVAFLFRQVPSGSRHESHLWLAQAATLLLQRRRGWVLEQGSSFVGQVIYSLLRLLVDHMGPHRELAIAESELCASLMQEVPVAWQSLGRDCVRLLLHQQANQRFSDVWDALIDGGTLALTPPSSSSSSSSSFGPTSPSVVPSSLLKNTEARPTALMMRMLASPTPPECLRLGITFDMERYLQFLMTKVPFGGQQYYESWFRSRLRTAERGHSSVPEMVRFVLSAFRKPVPSPSSSSASPSTQAGCPRWATLGFLVNKAAKREDAKNDVHLATLFDVLFASGDSMSVEPCVTLLRQSLNQFPHVTNELLRFMGTVLNSLEGPLRSVCVANVRANLGGTVAARTLCSSSKVDRDVAAALAPIVEMRAQRPIVEVPPNSPTLVSISDRNVILPQTPTRSPNKRRRSVTPTQSPLSPSKRKKKEKTPPVVIDTSSPLAGDSKGEITTKLSHLEVCGNDVIEAASLVESILSLTGRRALSAGSAERVGRRLSYALAKDQSRAATARWSPSHAFLAVVDGCADLAKHSPDAVCAIAVGMQSQDVRFGVRMLHVLLQPTHAHLAPMLRTILPVDETAARDTFADYWGDALPCHCAEDTDVLCALFCVNNEHASTVWAPLLSGNASLIEYVVRLSAPHQVLKLARTLSRGIGPGLFGSPEQAAAVVGATCTMDAVSQRYTWQLLVAESARWVPQSYCPYLRAILEQIAADAPTSRPTAAEMCQGVVCLVSRLFITDDADRRRELFELLFTSEPPCDTVDAICFECFFVLFVTVPNMALAHLNNARTVQLVTRALVSMWPSVPETVENALQQAGPLLATLVAAVQDQRHNATSSSKAMVRWLSSLSSE